MIVNLHNHPAYGAGIVVVHQIADFMAAKPEDHPITVRWAKLIHPYGAVQNVNSTFVFTHKEKDGTLNYIYQEKTS